MSDDERSENGPFDYNPSQPANIIFVVLWLGAAGLTLFHYFRHRAWFFWCMVVSVLMEAIGFILRAIAIQQRKSDTTNIPYIISFVLLLVAPSFTAAAAYMAVGRLIYYITNPNQRSMRTMWIPARFITPIFVGFDVLGFLIQTFGGIRAASASSDVRDAKTPEALKKATDDLNSGYTIARIGVIVQLVCFGFFTFIGARLLFVSRGWPQKADMPTSWRKLMWAINAGCALILFRAVYRLVEFIGGDASEYISEHEWFIYVFDAVPMLIVYVIFGVYPPAKYLPRLFMSVRFKKHLREQERKMASADVEGGYMLGGFRAQRVEGGDSEAALRPL